MIAHIQQPTAGGELGEASARNLTGRVATPCENPEPPGRILRVRVMYIDPRIAKGSVEGGLSSGFAPYKKTGLLNNFVPFLNRRCRK